MVPVRYFFAGIVLVVCLAPLHARADGFGDALIGVVTDPFGARRASSTLADAADRTMAGLRELEDKTNKDFSDRIDQVKEILESVIRAVNQNSDHLNQAIQQAVVEMRALERKTNKDLAELIDRAGCISEVATQDQIQRGLAKLISELKSSQPGLKFLGIRVLKADIQEVEIVHPDQAYDSTKRAMLAQLDAIKDDDSAEQILSIYQNLARFAGFAKCYYIGLGLDIKYAAEQRKYVRLSEPWLQIVGPMP